MSICIFIETPRDNFLTHIIGQASNPADAASAVRNAINDRPTEHGHAGVIWADGSVTNVNF